MAYYEPADIPQAYDDATKEADIWRVNYPELERLANNDLPDDLDETMPEVNDGSLAASLYKLPKRCYNPNMTGRAKALDRDEAWCSALANLQWTNNIMKNANTQAPFHVKWPDAMRKAAVYGGQPIITLQVDNGHYSGADFIVPQAVDVKLEAGKISDYDSNIIFWDVYYTKKQVETMLEQAEAEMKEAKTTGQDGYNKWDTNVLKKIIAMDPQEERSGNEEHRDRTASGVKRSGIHFYIAFQRGVGAPFYMCHSKFKDKPVRQWSNPDPTGDISVHYLYCYQDFINPYGIGIVKLAGSTQNILDYMRRADVLATQIGIRPPKLIEGQTDGLDEASMSYTEDANWYVGSAKVTRMEIANGVYTQLPDRIGMYKTSLNQLIPTGDTSISASSGDPNYSMTPAGVKFQQDSLSIDDEDFKEKLYRTYEAVACSMINTHFANMQGSDLMKLTDDERELLVKGGLEFPMDEAGNVSNELNIEWDNARAQFDFEMEAENDKAAEDADRLQGLLKVAEFRASDPNFDAAIAASGKKLNLGELYSEIVSLTTDNDKIITDITPDEQVEQETLAQQQQEMQMQPQPAQPAQQALPAGPVGGEAPPVQAEALPTATHPEDAQAEADVAAVMQDHNVDQRTAAIMLEAERQGFTPDEVVAAKDRHLAGMGAGQ
jgi:hypothetical protein